MLSLSKSRGTNKFRPCGKTNHNKDDCWNRDRNCNDGTVRIWTLLDHMYLFKVDALSEWPKVQLMSSTAKNRLSKFSKTSSVITESFMSLVMMIIDHNLLHRSLQLFEGQPYCSAPYISVPSGKA